MPSFRSRNRNLETSPDRKTRPLCPYPTFGLFLFRENNKNPVHLRDFLFSPRLSGLSRRTRPRDLHQGSRAGHPTWTSTVSTAESGSFPGDSGNVPGVIASFLKNSRSPRARGSWRRWRRSGRRLRGAQVGEENAWVGLRFEIGPELDQRGLMKAYEELRSRMHRRRTGAGSSSYRALLTPGHWPLTPPGTPIPRCPRSRPRVGP